MSGILRQLSIRTKFQTAFVILALAAVGLTGYIALIGASGALQEATYDRLTAIRETRRHALERYFEDLGSHVVALSTSETSALALDELRRAWGTVTPLPDAPLSEELERYYADTLAPRLTRDADRPALMRTWLPSDPRVRKVQQWAIAGNPHPRGSKDLLVEIPDSGDYGGVHARHHPTFTATRRRSGSTTSSSSPRPRGGSCIPSSRRSISAQTSRWSRTDRPGWAVSTNA